MLEIEQLSFGFTGGNNGDSDALVSDLSFSVEPGQLRLIQGRSGCGKSTLLKLISSRAPEGLNWSGNIKLNGAELASMPEEQRGVGILFQDPLLFPHLTVGDNLAFGLVRRPGMITRAERRAAVENALHVADLDGFAERDPASLSGGQAARVGLMRSLLAEPDALLLDEAFSTLDPELRYQFGSFVMGQVRERNIPALLVSHDNGDSLFASGDIITI